MRVPAPGLLNSVAGLHLPSVQLLGALPESIAIRLISVDPVALWNSCSENDVSDCFSFFRPLRFLFPACSDAWYRCVRAAQIQRWVGNTLVVYGLASMQVPEP